MDSPELVALMLADARLPTGGHTQSAGLEPAVRAGLGADGNRLSDVETYARDRLRTVARIEAGVAVVARHLALAGTSAPDSAGAARRRAAGARAEAEGAQAEAEEAQAEAEEAQAAGDVMRAEAAWAARTPSQALRAASRRQGRAYLRLAARVWPGVLDHLPANEEVARPVVVGVVGAVTGLSALQTARLIGYDDAQTVVAASLKLLPVDPADAACWLAALHPDIEELAASVAGLTSPADIPARGAPLVDVFAQAHAIERMRLFHA